MKYPIPNRRVLIFCLALGPAIAAVTWVAQSGQVPAARPEFMETQVMIPMRDGVKLHTIVFTPRMSGFPSRSC